MGKNKLQRFADIERFDNVLEFTDFQNNETSKPKGRWREDIFQNSNPVVLELACGKGSYTIELARRNPARNYIGIDIKGSRIWKGARKAKEEGLDNVRFLRMYIDHLGEYFADGEIDEIWITFPDPYPRGSDRNKRLTFYKYLSIYQTVLKNAGIIHLKTDSDSLFDFSKTSIQKFGCLIIDCEYDIYTDRKDDSLLTIKTDFERKHLEQGKTIKYLKFKLPESKGSL